MKVKEIMHREVTSVKPDDTAADALTMLFKMRISGLPVIDAEGKLAGMFTEKSILRFILPSYVEKVGRFVYEENPKSTKKKFNDLANVKVAQMMRKEVVTTSEETALSEVARIMLTQHARRLPVVDASLKVVGIVAREDILKALAKEAETAV